MSSILITDDDPNNQRMVSYSLRKAGYNILIAANGQAGFEILHNTAVDLLILDLSMPVMDGLTLLRHIRADAQLADTPVIIMTASGDEDELAIAQQIGIHSFLTKPSSSRVLLEVVAAALAETPAQ